MSQFRYIETRSFAAHVFSHLAEQSFNSEPLSHWLGAESLLRHAGSMQTMFHEAKYGPT